MINIQELVKEYKNGEETCLALNHINLNIQAEEFVAICGTSGSGKTTLFNILCGIDTEYNGSCKIYNQENKELSQDTLTILRRNEIGVIFQFFNLIESLSVEENIALSVELDQKKVNKEKLENIMKDLDILNKRHMFIHELSGGQKQRVAIARVLLSEANLILADEPTGNLDRKNSNNVIRILKDLNINHHKTVILITHDINVAKEAKRIIYIEDGMVVRDETN